MNRVLRWLYKRPVAAYWFPPVTWMLIIFILSGQSTLPSAPSGLLDFVIKKSGHMLEYAILLVLLWRALWQRTPKWYRLAPHQRLVASLVFAFLLAVVYAASDEFHQTFVPGRQGRLSDVVIDGTGSALAALVVWKARWIDS